MVEREVTWRERKEMKLALEADGITAQTLLERGEFPIEFAELALVYGYEDYRKENGKPDDDALNKLSDMEIAEAVSKAYMRIFHKAEIEKKS